MFSRTPELYDVIYGSFKDYRAESELIASELRARAPAARTILDVACGTGEHALYLHREHGYDVQGLDIEPAFVEIARAKLPEARFRCADMTDFALGERFDIIMCLFSSIGYVVELERLEKTFACFKRHLNPGGLVVLEPWFTPDRWHPGTVYVKTAGTADLHVVRMSHSGIRGRVSTLDLHYLIGRPDGIEHRVECHELGLFTQAEITTTLKEAGFRQITFDPVGIMDRGLYVASADNDSARAK